MTPEQDAYLREHVWALLATTRADGSPQVSMVAYTWDGTDAVVSCRRSTAKAANAARRPGVVLSVPDGRRYLSVAGRCEVVRADPERTDLTRRVQAALGPEDAASLEAEFERGLDVVGRVILRVVPDRVLGRI